MTFAQIIPPEPDPEPRVWGARSLDRSYRLDVVVRALTMDLVPEWLLFQLGGSGPLSEFLEWVTGANIVQSARRLGFEITEGTLVKVSAEEFVALVPAVTNEELMFKAGAISPEKLLAVSDFATPRAARRKRKRRR